MPDGLFVRVLGMPDNPIYIVLGHQKLCSPATDRSRVPPQQRLFFDVTANRELRFALPPTFRFYSLHQNPFHALCSHSSFIWLPA